MRHLLATASIVSLSSIASAQIVPGDTFDLDLSVTNATAGELLIEDNFTFGVDTVVADNGFGSFRVRTEETDLTAGDYQTGIIVEGLDGTIPPAGSTFGGAFATDFILAIGSINPLGNGFDYQRPININVVEGYVTVASDPTTLIGPFTAGAIEFGVSPSMQELRIDLGLGTAGTDLALEEISSILVLVRYSAIPEPTGLAGLATVGFLLRRRPRSHRSEKR